MTERNEIQTDDLDEIEQHLQELIEATEQLDADDTIEVERSAQRIHVCFGGTDLDAIYPGGKQ